MMNRHVMTFIISLMALTLSLFSPIASATTVWATVSKNKVVKNEVFQLRVVVDEKVSSDDIDFSTLDQDFYVSRPSFGSSINIVNGKRSTRSEWNLTLTAQTLGVARIPAFTVNGASSKPIAIQVTMDKNEPNISDLVELRSTIDKTSLYPNESASLRTRLIIKADPRRLQNPQVVPPKVEGMSIAQIGEPNQYQSVLGGVEVTVLEQTYRITAEKAGRYTLTGSAFKGSMILGNDRTGTTKLVSVDTPAKSFVFDVEAKPEGYTGVWLPTSQLSLEQSWTAAGGETIDPSLPSQANVGDSITRHVVLDIAGLTSDRFPNIKIDYPKSIRVYDEKPQFTELDNGVTRMTLKQVLIPQKTGEMALPEIRLNWWDSQNRQQRTAQVAGLSLEVAPGDSVNTPVPVSPAALPAEVETITVQDSGLWPYLTALFAILWLVTCVLLLRSRSSAAPADDAPVIELNSASAALQQALKNKDYFKAQHYAGLWLQEATQCCPQRRAEIEAELEKMQKSGFSQTETGWNPSTLLKLMSEVDKMPRSDRQQAGTLATL